MELNRVEHVHPIADSVVWLHHVLLCAQTHVPINVQHVSIIVETNAEHAHHCVVLVVNLHAILHVVKIALIAVMITAFIHAVKNVVHARHCVTHVQDYVSEYVL